MAPGSEVVVTLSGSVTAIVKVAAAVAAGLAESVTVTVNVLVPGAAGVPVMVPVDGSRVRPAGRDPLLSDQV